MCLGGITLSVRHFCNREISSEYFGTLGFGIGILLFLKN